MPVSLLEKKGENKKATRTKAKIQVNYTCLMPKMPKLMIKRAKVLKERTKNHKELFRKSYLPRDKNEEKQQ